MVLRAQAVTLTRVTLSPQPAKKPTTTGQKIGGFVILALVGACCFGGVTLAVKRLGGSDSGGSNNAPADRSAEAKWACEEFVKKQLKAPATAKFSGEAAAKAAKPVGDEYIASGSVDSQNSFGALLRSTFSCDITYDAAKQEWTSKSVDVVPA